MTRLQQFLTQAGRDLDTTVIVPFEFGVDSERRVVAAAWLPDLGAPKGMVIATSWNDIQSITPQLTDQGYGYSVLTEPSTDEIYDVNAFKALFSDWGWASHERTKPLWMP